MEVLFLFSGFIVGFGIGIGTAIVAFEKAFNDFNNLPM